MNLALRDVRHKLGRFALTCAGLGLLLGVALAMVGIYRGVVDEALALTRAVGAELWVVEGNTRGPFAEASRVPGDTREAVARLAGVREAGSLTLQTVEARVAGTASASAAGATRNEAGRERIGAPLRLQVIGHEADRPGGPRHLAQGRTAGGARRGIVLDTSARVPLGAVVEMGGLRFTVVGLTRGAVSSGGDPLGWILLRDAQELQFRLNAPAARRALAAGTAGPAQDTVNAVVVRLDPGADPARLAEEVRRWKHLGALTAAEQEEVLTRSVVERARRQLGLFTGVLLLVSGVIVALIIYMLTMDKLREIATLKLIGARDRTIVALVMQQALALGAASFTFGTALILLVKDVFPRRVALGPEEVGAVAGVVLAICLLASLLGVRAALRIEPAQALGG